MQRSLRLKAMLKAPKLKDNDAKVFDKGSFSMALQIESEYSLRATGGTYGFREIFHSKRVIRLL